MSAATNEVLLHATALNLMAQRGEAAGIRRAVRSGADVNEVQDDWFPLLMAVAVNQVAVVALLLESGADCDQADARGTTPLALAAQAGHVEVMHALLKFKADANKANDQGSTPLLLAAQTGNVAAVDVLLAHSARVNDAKRGTGLTPIHAAVRGGSTAVVARLLDAGADANAIDADGETPLLAAIRGSPPVAPRPARRGAGAATPKPPAARPPGGALREALVAILLAGGADADARGGGAETPLGACVRVGGARLTQRLLQHGANARVADGHGAPPLLLAACLRGAPRLKQQLEVAELLLAHGADVDATDAHGATPLHAAVYFGRPGLVRLLLSHGADANAAITDDAEEDDEDAPERTPAAGKKRPLRLPLGFTPLRLATAATAAENLPAASFDEDGEGDSEALRIRIADDLLREGAREPLDDVTLETADDVAAWFEAFSWHGRRTTATILQRLRNRGAIDAEALFAMQEAELEGLLDLDRLDGPRTLARQPSDAGSVASSAASASGRERRRPDSASSSLSTARTTRSAARLWFRKIQRQAALQRDRVDRAAVADALGVGEYEDDDQTAAGRLREPLDDAQARESVVASVRQAAAVYTRATVVSAVPGVPAEDLLGDVVGFLDEAAAICEEESRRLALAREAHRAALYGALRERWDALRVTTSQWARTLGPRAVGAHGRRVLQPPPALAIQGAAWWAAGEACPWFDAATAAEARLAHLRVRAAAARPILCGILSAAVDAVNGAETVAELGLSGTQYVLPFAGEPFCAVDDAGTRCRLHMHATLAFEALSKRAASMPASAADGVTDVVSATVEVEDPYVAAVVVAVLSQRCAAGEAPMRLEAVDDSINDSSLSDPRKRRGVKVVVTVMYPRDADEHHALTTAKTAGAAPIGEHFPAAMAGAELLACEVHVVLGQFLAIDALEAPYVAVAKLPTPEAQRRFLFTNRLDFLDADTWTPAVPPAVVAYRRRRQPPADDNGGDRLARCEDELGAALDSAARTKAHGARTAEALRADLRDRDAGLAEARDDLAEARRELREATDEIARLRQAPDGSRRGLDGSSSEGGGSRGQLPELGHVAQPPPNAKPILGTAAGAPGRAHRKVLPEAPALRYA
ncbi:hypothetical protein M885DRAFT_622840 [Pelagophyceae sp. CCMP2097]|nr:hypothetical protein M885DRAFT_622840 [Pelagophyceae sp. CCMP2097]